MLKVIGVLLIIFGLIDLGAYYIIDIDITGLWWFPWAATALGGFLVNQGRKQEEEEEE